MFVLNMWMEKRNCDGLSSSVLFSLGWKAVVIQTAMSCFFFSYGRS